MTTATKNDNLAELFNGLAADGPDPDQPWLLDGWLWATNGHALVAVKDDGRPSAVPPEKYLKAQRYLTDAIGDAVPLAVAALRAFVGPISEPTECDDCDGDGYSVVNDTVECEHCGKGTRLPCDGCDGDGVVLPRARYAHVHGVVVNLELLARSLSFVPDADASMGRLVSLKSKHPALAIVAEAWRVVVMGCANVTHTIPAFIVPRPGFACDACGHTHQGERLAFICIGCPCEHREQPRSGVRGDPAVCIGQEGPTREKGI